MLWESRQVEILFETVISISGPLTGEWWKAFELVSSSLPGQSPWTETAAPAEGT
jgi:hypothetical protein